MINAIQENIHLFRISRGTCEENEMGVSICEALLKDGEIDDDKVAILKVDEYYNTRDFAIPPKSIDCLIVLKRADSAFCLYLIELKNVSKVKSLRPSAIVAKFKTAVDRFMGRDSGDIFLSGQFEIEKLRLMLVADPFNAGRMTEEEYRRRIKGTVLDAYQSMKPFKFRGHIRQIEHRPPPLTACI